VNRYTVSYQSRFDGNIKTQEVDADSVADAKAKTEDFWDFGFTLKIVPAPKKTRINKSFHEAVPNNCPLIELDGDGKEVGTCTYSSPNGICPRHGNWKDLVKDESTN
jgi:hypothetical protein